MAPESIVDKPGALAFTLAARLEREAEAAQAARGRYSLAISGGSVATALFPRFATARIDWSRTDFFWCDERAVPPDDAESNFGAARTLWLEPAGVPEASIHRMEGEAADLTAAAEAYAQTLRRVLGDPPRLDTVLLGMGPDGHICSLFPGHPLLACLGRGSPASGHRPGTGRLERGRGPGQLGATCPAEALARGGWFTARGAGH